MQDKKVKIELFTWKRKVLYFFISDTFCIRYDENYFACLVGTKVKLIKESDVDVKCYERIKMLDRQKYLLGKAYLTSVVKNNEHFTQEYKFISGYIDSITRI